MLYWGAFVLQFLQWKTKSITYSECAFLALGIQHAMRMRRIILSSVACPALHYFSTSPHQWHEYRKKKIIAYKMRVLIFSTTFVWNIRLSKKSWDICDHKRILVFMYSARYPCQIFINLAFSRLILEKYSNIRFHDSPSSGSIEVPCGRTDRQTDMTWCFSDRASWIYCILFNNFCALIIIYS